jgi:hypothetical protein
VTSSWSGGRRHSRGDCDGEGDGDGGDGADDEGSEESGEEGEESSEDHEPGEVGEKYVVACTCGGDRSCGDDSMCDAAGALSSVDGGDAGDGDVGAGDGKAIEEGGEEDGKENVGKKHLGDKTRREGEERQFAAGEASASLSTSIFCPSLKTT